MIPVTALCVCSSQWTVTPLHDNGIIVIVVHVFFLPSFPLCVQELAEVTSVDLPVAHSPQGAPPTSAPPTSSIASSGMVIYILGKFFIISESHD